MGTEIERKFLVRDVSVVNDAHGIPYRQGYLSTVPERTVQDPDRRGSRLYHDQGNEYRRVAGRSSSTRSRSTTRASCYRCAYRR